MDQSTLNQLFDKIYVINLDKRKDKLATRQQSFNDNNISYERFKALTPMDSFMNKKSEFFKKTFPKERWGAVACTMSHRAVLEKALKKNQSVLICEDDLYFCDNFNDILSEKLKTLPGNWNALHLGYNRGASYVYTHNMAKFKNINEDWETFDMFSGCTCWGFKPGIIPVVLEYLNKYPTQNFFNSLQIDLTLACLKLYDDPRIKMYSTIEPLVFPKMIGQSDTGLN